MAEEIQALLERIQSEGIDKAKKEAQKIIEEAKKNAEEIIQNAEKQAETLLNKAKQEAELFHIRAEKSIQQAGRDVIKWVEVMLEEIFNKLLLAETTKVMADTEFMKRILANVLGQVSTANITILTSKEDEKNMLEFICRKFSEKCKNGIKVEGNDTITKGFKIIVENGNVEHDFTDEAVAEALSRLLRPQLARLVNEAIKKNNL